MRIPVVLLILLFSLNSFSQGGTFVPKKTPSPATTLPKQPSKKNPSQNSSSTLKTLIVLPETVPCLNNSSSQCLQVKKQGSTEFETIEDIENFNYDIGYTYTVQVKEIMKTPPIGVGESVFRYIWIKTINKKEFIEEAVNEATKDSPDLTPKTTYQSTYNNGKIIGQTNIITGSELDKKWYLRKLKNINGESLITDDNVMWIEIKTFNDRIEGFGSCNKFWTVVKSDLNTTFEVSKLTTNYAQCGYKKLEDMFYDLLQQANRFEIRNGNLVLSDQWKFLLGFTSNPDNKEDIAITYTPQNIVKDNEKTYATSNKSEDRYVPPVKTTTTSESTTSSQSVFTKTTPNNTSDDAKIAALEAKKKEIEELKKELDPQYKPEEISKLKQEEEIEILKKQLEEKKKQDAAAVAQAEIEKQKLAKLKEIEDLKIKEEEKKKLADIDAQAAKQAEIEKQKLAKQKEIDELKKQLAEKESEITNTETNNNSSIILNNSKSIVSIDYLKIPEPDISARVYYLGPDNILNNLERTNAVNDFKMKGLFRGSESYYSTFEPASPIRFTKQNLPVLIVKLEGNIDPLETISIAIGIVKKDRRSFKISSRKFGGKTNEIDNSFLTFEIKKIRNNIYQLILPSNIEVGEYAFMPIINTSDLNSLLTSSQKLSCFGIDP